MNTMAAERVGHLIVVLDEINKLVRLQTAGPGAAILLLPRVVLALIQKAPFSCGKKFLRVDPIVAIARLCSASERGDRRMLKAVVPTRIQAVAAIFWCLHQPHLLRL